MEPDNLLTTAQAAARLGLSPSMLAKMRLNGTGPRFQKLGAAAVRYAPRALEEWVEAGTRRSTSDAAA